VDAKMGDSRKTTHWGWVMNNKNIMLQLFLLTLDM